MMRRPSTPLLQIHLAVLLFGLAGLFGKWLTIPAEIIVLGRAAFAAIFLAGLMAVKGESFRLKKSRDAWAFLLLGAILAFHWVAFFRGIQLSTVAIGLLSFASFPLFTTLLEPLVFRESISGKQILLALIVLLGVYLVVPAFDWQAAYTQGVLWGLASGASFAVLSLLNRWQVRAYPPRQIACYQNAVAALCLLPFWWLSPVSLSPADWGLLLLLGIVFTGLSHSLFIRGLMQVRASTASLIAGLEPVYGILAAWWWLGEIPELHTLLGGVLIVGAGVMGAWGEG